MLNYFRVKNRDVCVFFDDSDYTKTAEAFDEAKYVAQMLSNTKPVLYRPCSIEGPWNNSPLVGHRDRAEIMADIEMAQTVEECISYSAELDALKKRFDGVGAVPS